MLRERVGRIARLDDRDRRAEKPRPARLTRTVAPNLPDYPGRTLSRRRPGTPTVPQSLCVARHACMRRARKHLEIFPREIARLEVVDEGLPYRRIELAHIGGWHRARFDRGSADAIRSAGELGAIET